MKTKKINLCEATELCPGAKDEYSYNKYMCDHYTEAHEVNGVVFKKINSKGMYYELVEDYYYQSNIRPAKQVEHKYFTISTTGQIVIKKGYRWNGANGCIDTNTNFRGAALHDPIYQAIELGLLPKSYRKAADKLYIDVCKEDGMNCLRRGYSWVGVRLFGGFFC